MSLYGPTFYVTPVDLCIIFQCNLYISCIMSFGNKIVSNYHNTQFRSMKIKHIYWILRQDQINSRNWYCTGAGIYPPEMNSSCMLLCDSNLRCLPTSITSSDVPSCQNVQRDCNDTAYELIDCLCLNVIICSITLLGMDAINKDVCNVSLWTFIVHN